MALNATGISTCPGPWSICHGTHNDRENIKPMLRALGDKAVHVLVMNNQFPMGPESWPTASPPSSS